MSTNFDTESGESKFSKWLEVAKDPTSPPVLLEVLLALPKDIKNYLPGLREALAQNPNTPIPALEQLATDFDEAVRLGVARNPSCSPEILEQLAKDLDENVRQAASQHFRQAPRELI